MALATRHVENDDSPTLIGQLRELREEWGEGFDEDIAQPLAAILVTMRRQLRTATEEHDKKVDELEEKLDEYEQEGEENAAKAGSYDELLDDLSDIPRGIRTLEEIMDKHPLEASV